MVLTDFPQIRLTLLDNKAWLIGTSQYILATHFNQNPK